MLSRGHLHAIDRLRARPPAYAVFSVFIWVVLVKCKQRALFWGSRRRRHSGVRIVAKKN